MSRFTVLFVALAVLYGKARAGTNPMITSGNAATLAEDTAVGTEIQTITTVDIPNVVVMIDSQMPMSTPPKFNITGMKVMLHDMLDYETAMSYTLMIKAMDSQNNMVSAMQTMTITVTNVVEAPMFMMMTYTADVMNGTMADMSVANVTATPDSGRTLTYTIDSGNTNMDFKINNMGHVMTNKMIDRSTAMYTLVIKAMDNGTPPLTGTATLSVTVPDPATMTTEGNFGNNVMAGVLSVLTPLMYFLFF